MQGVAWAKVARFRNRERSMGSRGSIKTRRAFRAFSQDRSVGNTRVSSWRLGVR